MGDRPVIPMSGQPAGQVSPPPPPVSGGNSSLGSGYQAPKPKKSSRSSLINLWKNLRRRVKKNPAVWWPGIIVAILLAAGVVVGGPNPSSTNSAQTTNVPKGSEQPTPKATGTINDLIVHSIVSIVVYENGTPCASGSGSIVGDGLHVLTNDHVISSDEDCTVDEIRVRTVSNSGEIPSDSYVGKVEAHNQNIDLAILSLTPMGSTSPVLRPLQLATGDTVGQDLIVVGFPAVGGDSVTVSKGIISGFVTQEGVQWIKTDAALSGGNSGGAALDSKNRLIGIPTMYSQNSDGSFTDCRHGADTNGDGTVDEQDTCVGIGGTFTLMATSATAIQFAKSIGLDISGRPSSSSTTSPPKK